MELRNNSGITLIALVITVIVMLIIAAVTIHGGTQVIKEAKVEDIKTNMLLIQAKLKIYVEQAKFEKKTIDDLTSQEDGTITLTNNSSSIKLKNSAENGFYKIVDPDSSDSSTATLSAINLSDLKSEDYLVSINIDSIDVVVKYVPGVTDSDGKTYDKLVKSELKEKEN